MFFWFSIQGWITFFLEVQFQLSRHLKALKYQVICILFKYLEFFHFLFWSSLLHFFPLIKNFVNFGQNDLAGWKLFLNNRFEWASIPLLLLLIFFCCCGLMDMHVCFVINEPDSVFFSLHCILDNSFFALVCNTSWQMLLYLVFLYWTYTEHRNVVFANN